MFEFDEREADLNSYVFQALGAASMCWDPRPSTQVFDSTCAKAIGDALVEKIELELDDRMEKALENLRSERNEAWRFIAALAAHGELIITKKDLTEIPGYPTFERYDDPITGDIRIRLEKPNG